MVGTADTVSSMTSAEQVVIAPTYRMCDRHHANLARHTAKIFPHAQSADMPCFRRKCQHCMALDPPALPWRFSLASRGHRAWQPTRDVGSLRRKVRQLRITHTDGMSWTLKPSDPCTSQTERSCIPCWQPTDRQSCEDSSFLKVDITVPELDRQGGVPSSYTDTSGNNHHTFLTNHGLLLRSWSILKIGDQFNVENGRPVGL